ncbi:MAG: stage V sporulation T C-terminal domain-containing protein [Acutalibacteraceae bacterium]|nr:stage V sporulation T C-terminal domain-containing protein [Acutalibacteraceae bacterium]
MAKNIAAYMRISVDTEKDRDNTSIENQRRIIKTYIKQTFPDAEVDYYEDRDKSGYTFEQREDYQRMRPLLMNGHYDILIIKDFSRFSRRNSRGLVELEDLRDAGVRIISIGDGIDYPTYDDWNNIQVRFLLNEMPVTDASKKVKRVVESRQNDGNWICAVPYGYYFVDTKNMIFEVDEKAAVVVREIFRLYNEGWGYKKIANYLTEKNIPTPRMVEKERKEAEAAKSKGKVEVKIKASPIWAIPSISGILQNDFYIGTLRQHKYTRKNINGADKKLDEDEHKVFENHHPAIVDVKEFMKAQQHLKARTKSNYRGVKKYDTTYSGFLFCGDCGSPMFSMSRPDLAPAYTCGTYHKRGLKGCTSHHTRIDLLDTMLKKYIERVMMNSEKMIAELEKAIKSEPQMMKTSASTIANLEVDLAKARESYKATQKQKIRELMKAEGVNREIIEETYEEMETELLQKIDGLEKQLEMTVERRNTTIEVNRIAKTALQIFRDILDKDKLDKGDLPLIVDRIVVFDGEEPHIDIELKADIAMLLEAGTLTDEQLEEAGYRGKVVNFNWDIEGNLSATIVQTVKNQRDKAFGVNVICGGDPLEIYTDSGGEVIFKKYSPIGELSSFAAQYADALTAATDLTVLICDRDHCIAASGISKKEVLERRVTQNVEDIMEGRRVEVYPTESAVPAIEGIDQNIAVAAPIIAAGDVSGAVVLTTADGESAKESDIKLATVAASFLGKQMEN